MFFKKTWAKLNDKVHQISRFFWFKKDYRHRYKQLKEHSIPIRKLNKKQKADIKKVWGRLYNHDYSTHELIYSITGEFNPYYCSTLTFGSYLEFVLNNDIYKRAWSDKNFFDLHFPKIRFPYTIVRNIKGVFYDHEYNQIDVQKAIDLLSSYNSVVIKPSTDTGMGNGVKLISINDDIKKVFESYQCDYLVQEVLEQYEPIKALNPTSVNIIRLNSLFINGNWSYLSASLRVGGLGDFTDNHITADGKGMAVIGITNDGTLKEHAYYPCGERIETLPNGVAFGGLRIPNFDKAKKIAEEIHRKMPFAKYVGFDIAFDKSGMPVVIEYNINAPGVFYYQLANGPLFGELTKCVLDEVLGNR